MLPRWGRWSVAPVVSQRCIAVVSQRDGTNQREFERIVLPGTRPIRLYFPQPEQAEGNPWVYADIIDISVGGMCLALEANRVLAVDDRLVLDFRDHQPSAESPLAAPVNARIRWVDQSPLLLTVGVQFDAPIDAIPDLMTERRTARRFPAG